MSDISKKILIVEDEKPVSRALQIKLSKAGFEVKVASNGKEALEIIPKEKFDLILLDLVMPEVDGFRVLETIKNAGIQIPVIVTSNLGQEEDIERARELGAYGYIIKSNTPLSEITQEVQNILH